MILRACVVCGALSDESRCPEHRSRPWQGSTRRQRTRSGWAQQRRARAILMLHGGICHVCGGSGATEVDHVVPLAEGGEDRAANLRPIHVDCHERKTAQEAARGRARRRPRS